MKILIVNKFLYPKGGDAVCALKTGSILIGKGHHVEYWGMSHLSNPYYPLERLFVDNVDYNAGLGKLAQLKAAFNIIYSLESKAKIRKVFKIFRPDIVHLHNFAHQISPSIIDVFKQEHIPVVMTMHDYKMICPAYSLLQPNTICNCGLCRYGAYYHCFFKKCVKNSRLKSLINTIEMYLHHNLWHIYSHVHTYISPSQFLKEQAENMGFKGRVVCIPNSLDVNEFKPKFDQGSKYVLYLGRLAEGKGIMTLIKAFAGIKACNLRIVGDGPLRADAERLANECNTTRVDFLGYRTGQELKDIVRDAMFVVVPSEWYENNPLSVIEAFALGKPVVGSRIGGIPELVKDKETGLTFDPWDVNDLREKIEYFIKRPELVEQMGRNARCFVEQLFNTEVYYQKLMLVYEKAIDDNRK